MILSAREAKAIADDYKEEFDKVINGISSKIIKAAEAGLYYCNHIFYIDSYVHKNRYKIKDAIEKEGYEVNITRIDPFSACFTRFEFSIYWNKGGEEK